jgi:dipeptidyl aminopeptidase/acylaminoacyl peptidase
MTAAIIVLAGCGTTTAAGNTATGTPTATTTATPAPGFRVLLSVTTSAGLDIVLYDSASSAPQKLVSIPAGTPAQPRFVSDHEIAYVETTNQGTSRIMKLDLTSRQPVVDLSAPAYVPAFAYKHDGSALAYLLHDPSTGKAALHWRTNGHDTTYGLNNVPGRGVGPDDEVRLQYSPDDKYLLMVDTFVGQQAQAPETGQFLVFRADKTVAFVPPSGTSTNATHAVWSKQTNRLYYRDASGIRTWDAEVHSVGTLVSGVHWYEPSPSADGRWIVYTTIDALSVPHVKLLDLSTAGSSDVSAQAPRSHAIFVGANTIFYLEEAPCTTECLGGGYQSTGKILTYSLTTKAESALPITDVNMLSDLAVR